MRILIAVALLLARFQCFFRRSLGLINRLNLYAVGEYHNGASYSENQCKKRKYIRGNR